MRKRYKSPKIQEPQQGNRNRKNRKKQKWRTGIEVLLLMGGLCICLYPWFSNLWNEGRQSRVIARYQECLKSMDQDAYQEQLLAARSYNETLAGKGIDKSMTAEEKNRYERMLDMYEDGMMGYIEIPAIECRLPIYHGTEESVLQKGSGHLESSSLPVGGKNSHCVLSGHRGLTRARLFTRLDQLKEGDRFTLFVLQEELTYEVERIVTVLPEDTSLLQLKEDRDLCTLVTCTPYGINSHRLLICGTRVSSQPEGQETEAGHDTEEKEKEWMKWIKEDGIKICPALLVLILICCLCRADTVRAEGTDSGMERNNIAGIENIIKEDSGVVSYTIEVHCEVPGVEFSLYYAEQGTDYGYAALDTCVLKNTCGYETVYNDSQINGMQRKEEVLHIKTDEQNSPRFLKSEVTNSHGIAIFQNLEAGTYIILGDSYEDDTGIYTGIPSEITLPEVTGIKGSREQKVKIYPKFEQQKENEFDSTEKEPENNIEQYLPQTGQLWWPVLLLAAGGILLCILGKRG